MAENGASLTILVNGNMNAAREDRLAEIAPGADIRVFEHKADLEANMGQLGIRTLTQVRDRVVPPTLAPQGTPYSDPPTA